MIGSELNLNYQTIHDILTKELGMWTRGCYIMTALSQDHLREPSFDKKGYSSGSAAPILT
jgi:hypothetical protein